MQNNELGAEGESRPAAGTKTKQATSENLEKAGEKTLQVQMIQKVLEQLASMENQMKQMEDRSKQIEEQMTKMPEEVQQQVKTVVQGEVTNIVQKVTNIVEQQVTSIVQQQVTSIVQQQVTSIVQQQVTSIVQQRVATIVQEQVAAVMQQQFANITVPSTGELSYADIARTPPGSHPSNLRSLSINTTPSTGTDTLYCTLDTSKVEEGDKNKANPGTIRRAIETEVQHTGGQEGWRCVAVTKDPKNPERIRVACRNEAELMRVKEAVKKTSQPGTRML
jgi:hypothetical protein